LAGDFFAAAFVVEALLLVDRDTVFFVLERVAVFVAATVVDLPVSRFAAATVRPASVRAVVRAMTAAS
jgi:hypothetical protein